MNDHQKKAKQLRKAADLLRRKDWNRGYYALDKDGSKVGWSSPKAESFCMVGAICHAGRISLDFDFEYDLASHIRAISRSQNWHSVTYWNDYKGRTKGQVIKMLEKIAKRYEKEAK